MKYSRLLVLISPVLILFLFKLFFFIPKAFYFSVILANAVIFFTINAFNKAGLKDKIWWNLLILPMLFLTSLAGFSVIIINKIIVQTLFAVNSLFIYYYLRNVYYYLVHPAAYKSHTLENTSSYGNFLVIFFSSSLMYGLQSFLNISIWLLIIIFLPIVLAVVYNIIWVNKLNVKSSVVYILISGLILTEIAWALYFLPLSYSIIGFILAICYYMLIGIIRFYLKENLNKTVARLYLGFGFFSIAIILLTAKWM